MVNSINILLGLQGVFLLFSMYIKNVSLACVYVINKLISLMCGLVLWKPFEQYTYVVDEYVFLDV